MDAPFIWGDGGAQLTPEQIAARRKAAEAMMLQSGDYSPVRSAWQGVARAAQGLVGGFEAGQADRAERSNADANKQLIASLLSGSTAGTPAASISTAPAVAGAAPVAADTTGKIYSNDEPSPLDPPSGDDRVRMAKTILGESANEPAAGQNAVASVIRTRAVDGGYGGDTPSGVVLAKNQFEPWNTPDGQARMDRAYADPNQRAKAEAAIAAAYGEGGRAPNDPTEGMTHFYSPGGQAAMGRSAPTWAGGESVTIGGHVFNSPDDVKSAALPPNSQPVQGVLPTAEAVAPVTKVAGAMSSVNPNVIAALTNPAASPQTKQIAGIILQAQLSKEKKDQHTQQTDAAGNVWDVNTGTGQRTVALKKDKEEAAPQSVREYEYYTSHLAPGTQPMPYDAWSTAKSRAGATNISNNIDMNSGQTYDKQLAEGLGKSHAALANGVEDAQTRARDVAAMQGAVDAIQKNGGTTGGMAPAARLEMQKSINAGAAALGIDKPFSEADISDKEFLTKFNRSMAGAQAKNAVGSRVTNFEMSNFLKANPGLDMTITGNQRLLGIQGQIEQRNIAVGNSIRNATAEAISKGKKIDPVTVQKIITDYDENNHVKDPTTGQDLTQSYALPEFQSQGTNPALAARHDTNVGKIRRYNPATGALE